MIDERLSARDRAGIAALPPCPALAPATGDVWGVLRLIFNTHKLGKEEIETFKSLIEPLFSMPSSRA